jgi:hypothetical protein
MSMISCATSSSFQGDVLQVVACAAGVRAAKVATSATAEAGRSARDLRVLPLPLNMAADVT